MTTVESRLGTVTSVSDGAVTVCIQQLSACSGCHARQACSSADCADRYITIPDEGQTFAVGQEVRIEGDDHVGRLAVLISFVIPIALVVASLAIYIALGMSEALSALASLATIGVYFAVVRLFNPSLGRILRLRLVRHEAQPEPSHTPII